jgi:hypothetical protein
MNLVDERCKSRLDPFKIRSFIDQWKWAFLVQAIGATSDYHIDSPTVPLTN